jgi:A/G-specific adenine glycosylase
MAAPPPERLAADLIAWFFVNGRDYPWRRTRDPYAILVSEVMLQQTQITTVLERGFYTRWMERFPNFSALASATENDVLAAWQGLGYYRRARHLHKLAQIITQQHQGIFPTEPTKIRELPGIGPYTAGAIASFAYGLAEPIVDGNVARVLSRLDNNATPVDSGAGSRWLWERARSIVQAATDPRALNSALMELGQLICRPVKPGCMFCPVHSHCLTRDPEKLPVKSARPVMTEITERVFFHQTAEGILLEQETGSRRTGLWKLPALPELLHTNPPPALLKTTYGITRYKVTLWVHSHEPDAPPSGKQSRIPLTGLADLPMPSPYRRAMEKLIAQRAQRV